MIRAKRAACVAGLALAFLSPPQCAGAATITNGMDLGWPLYSLAVNAGDTVTWVNWQPSYRGTNYVESYGGEWRSPPMVNLGDSFSFTFTNPGFYAYRTGVKGISLALLRGTVTVSAWTSAPPAVTLNAPVGGFVLSFIEGAWVQASVTNQDGPAEMQYFANSSLIGITTNPPYGISWLGATQGQYLLVAKAIDRQGGAACSQPVSVTVGPALAVWGTRRLPTGEMLFFYNAVPADPLRGLPIYSSDSPLITNPTPLETVGQPGVFVDESLRGTTVPRRFYGFYPGLTFH